MSRCGALCALLLLATGLVSAAPDPGFDVVVGTLPDAKPGERATVSLSILPRPGFRLLVDGPLTVRVTGEGVTPERPLYRREDAVDPRAEAPRFELAFRRPRPPAHEATLNATLTFYLCRGERCRPVTEPVYIRDRRP